MPFAFSNTIVVSEEAMKTQIGSKEGNPVLPEARRQVGRNEHSHFKCLSFSYEYIP